MVITATELFLLCWAGLVTGLYFGERSKRRGVAKLMDYFVRGIARKELHVSEDENGQIHLRKTS